MQEPSDDEIVQLIMDQYHSFANNCVLSISIHKDYGLQFYFPESRVYTTDKKKGKHRRDPEEAAGRRVRPDSKTGYRIYRRRQIMVTVIVLGAAMAMYVGAEWTMEEVED